MSDTALDHLLERLCRGDLEAAEQVFVTYEPYLRQVVRRQLPAPDLLLGYLVKRRPRLASNPARVHTTNNLHRVYLKKAWQWKSGLLAASALNAASMLTVELLGRIGAAGVLKIEPGDASKIRLVHPDAIAAVKAGAGKRGSSWSLSRSRPMPGKSGLSR